MTTDNFTFNGKHSFRDMGLYTELVSQPLFAEPKTVSEDLPGTDGEIDFSLSNPKKRLCFKPRIIELECHFASPYESSSSYFAQLNKMAQWLAEGKQKTLRFDSDPDIVYYATAANLFNIERITDFSGSFPLVFKCDPFKYSSSSSVSFGADGVVCINEGYYCGFSLNITGKTADSFKVTSNRFPDKALIINYPMAEYDTISVNMRNMTVTHNGISILSKCDGDFFELAPGENKISIDGDDITYTEAVFTQRWL